MRPVLSREIAAKVKRILRLVGFLGTPSRQVNGVTSSKMPQSETDRIEIEEGDFSQRDAPLHLLGIIALVFLGTVALLFSDPLLSFPSNLILALALSLFILVSPSRLGIDGVPPQLRFFYRIFFVRRLVRWILFSGLASALVVGLLIIFAPSALRVQIVNYRILSYLDLVMVILYSFRVPIDRGKEGRLCIKEFLAHKTPNERDYVWLQRGMNRAERCLKMIGLSMPRGRLYLGSSYAILNGVSIEVDLRAVADWMGGTASTSKGWPQFDTIVSQAEQAEKAGFGSSPTLEDYLSSFWENTKEIVVVGVGLVTIIAFFLNTR